MTTPKRRSWAARRSVCGIGPVNAGGAITQCRSCPSQTLGCARGFVGMPSSSSCPPPVLLRIGRRPKLDEAEIDCLYKRSKVPRLDPRRHLVQVHDLELAVAPRGRWWGTGKARPLFPYELGRVGPAVCDQMGEIMLGSCIAIGDGRRCTAAWQTPWMCLLLLDVPDNRPAKPNAMLGLCSVGLRLATGEV